MFYFSRDRNREQSTTRRENRSSTAATQSQPSTVEI
jgi:hypothetical protein